jgi:hypothetical protein
VRFPGGGVSSNPKKKKKRKRKRKIELEEKKEGRLSLKKKGGS